MKILVPIKRVPDYQAKVKLKSDGSGIEEGGVKWIVNPFDEIAVEEAIKIKESGAASEVVVVGMGPPDVSTQLRYAMAMGADRGWHILYDGVIDSDLAARILVWVYNQEQPKLVIMGKQAIDSDANQTAQLLAARLRLPQGCFISKLEISGDSASLTREVDGGLEMMKVPLPAVVSTDLRLNTPRYASLPGIMKAKKKELKEIQLGETGVSPDLKVKVLSMRLPNKRSAGKKVGSASELAAALRDEAKVI